MTRIPRFTQFFVLAVRFFLLWGLGHYILVICFLFCLLFLFFRLFFEHFMLFYLFWSFGHFCSVRSFSLFCFFLLFFLALMHCLCYMHAWGVPGHPLHPQYWPIYSVALMCRPRHPCSSISPHTPLPKLWPADLSVCLFALFCVCWVPMHPPAPIRTHTHPPESLLTPLCLRAHMCLFWGNFPAIQGRELYPASPFMSLFVLFSCALVLGYPTTPIQTHIQPHTRVHTRPHPRLLWNICTSVNLIKL